MGPRAGMDPAARTLGGGVAAVPSVSFGGFSARAIHDRVEDAGSAVLVTADAGYRRGNLVPLKKTVDEAIADLAIVRHVVVLRRAGGGGPVRAGREAGGRGA